MAETRYQTGELLGRGAMAEVYRGMDTRLGRPVAIKRLRPDLATNPTFRARFRREATAAAKLNHPGIVAVLDTGEQRAGGISISFIVMELVDGASLRDTPSDGGAVAPERALEITGAILDALAASHRGGVIHRDIKPANVMLTASGQIKVADFGIARALSDASATLTQTATVMGTAQYMSPEQARGDAVDPRSDLYSVGCLLYELLVGRPPFTGDSPVSIAYQQVSEPPVAPSARDPRIPADIDGIVMKALAKAPAERYQSAEQMKADIAGVLSGQRSRGLGPAVSSRTPIDRPTRADIAHTTPRRDRGRRLAVLATVVLLILAVVGYGYTRLSTTQTLATSEVPAVIGFSQEQAESLLRNVHLIPRVHLVNGPIGTVNTVITQTPTGGQKVAPNSVVVVEINAGHQQATIPRGLLGRNVDQVRKILTKAGFSTSPHRPARRPPTPPTAR